VSPDQREIFLKKRHLLFEDPGACVTQAGKLKLEGVWASGLFRAVKCYHLEKFPEDEETKTIARSKGVSRRITGKMSSAHFNMEQQKMTFYQGFSLKPTMGGEMSLTGTSRRATDTLNFKRKLIVSSPLPSSHCVRIPPPTTTLVPFQDRVFTKPLD
jgi:hypothetical protein